MDLTISVCVLIVATVGTGAVEVGVGGVGWVNTLTLYLLLAIVVFLLLSFTLSAGDFLTLGLMLGQAGLCGFVAYGFVVIGLVVAGSVGSWTWDQVSLPVLGMFSFSGQERGKVRVLYSRITFNYLGCPVPSKCMYSLHCFYFHLYIYYLHG